MKYLLDSNAVIEMMRGNGTVTARLMQHEPGDFAISAIVAHELFYGAYRGKRRDENLRRIEAMQLEVLKFDREDARYAAEIRAHLAASGMTIGPYDVLIAGQAMARSLILVTHNLREFSRVQRLVYEDWQVPM